MSDSGIDDVADRLRAWSAGKPLPRWNTRCVDIAEDPFVVALVRVGGEGRPAAIAYGKASSTPSVCSTPDSREPRAVAEMVETFGSALLTEFPAEEDLNTWPQLLLPDRSHLDLLHQMAFAYAFAKWPLADMGPLNTVGRLFNALFLQWQNPVQNTVLLASDVLQSLYTFPASLARHGHLAFLLEWLVDHGNRVARREAATKAEQRSVSTSLDGAVENQEIADLLKRYEQSKRTHQPTAIALKRVLEKEALDRWHLARAAHQSIRLDPRPPNYGLRTLRSFSRRSWSRLWVLPRQRELSGERVYWRGTETDMSAVGAAEEMMMIELATQMRQEALAHGDIDIALSLVRRGKAVHGTVVASHSYAGTLTVEYDNTDEVDFREGTTYRPFGTAELQVRFESADPSVRVARFTVEKGTANFKIGDEIILIEYNPDFFVMNKIRNMSQQSTTVLGQLLRAPLSRSGEATATTGDE